ncbi:hypothetical protein CANCADRAFT_147418 [Tortispora caseinolytica NRRL Y-17796]|uniref:Rhodanese domain-containing protein n=1 Tax=Tortispora caseinolytica NRRL Y-17796 TaxID=767744 RepID=A0A1E4TJA5_9ASCO|nr:hypothetical protein CANCADRAFT_147418 [Tortispora caseinolytica NRRL Y-17796]
MKDLTLDEYQYYGRQMLVPEFGKSGQVKLKNSTVAIIGAGGLGCPCGLYLGCAGVGTLKIVDFDTVDTSNLHRQIAHTEIGANKAESLAKAIKQRNANVRALPYPVPFAADNASQLLEDVDLVLDCTDSPAIRYLINDICYAKQLPLISAAALRSEGQLSILCYPGGPCYRCLFPHMPAVSQSCSDNGILGPVVGVMGVMQAAEALKFLALGPPQEVSMLIFSLFSPVPWRRIKMKGKRPDCINCGENGPDATKLATYYANVCDTYPVLDPSEEVPASQLENTDVYTIDVRDPVQYEICSLPFSKNVPLSKLEEWMETHPTVGVDSDLYVLCRRGNDSRTATQILRQKGRDRTFNVHGGLEEYSKTDPTFPTY